MITITDLTHRYKSRVEPALKNINVQIATGENVFLLGPSGSGKSTLMKCISRLIEPIAGDIIIDGENILKTNAKRTEQIRRRIGVIFQEFNLVERETVLNNTLNGRLGYLGTFGTLLNNFSKRDYDIIETNLRTMDLITLKDERVCHLSGGQKQRVAIARALSQQPSILLADEPVSNLDPKLAESMMILLHEVYKTKGLTSITSIHDIEIVRKFATRVIGLKDGSIVFDSGTKELSDKDLSLVYGEKWR